MPKMARVAFVGLGVMGGPMAGHLVAAGHDVAVWNRTAAKTKPLQEQGATVVEHLTQVASGREIVFLCVSRTEDVLSCLRAMMPGAAPGTLFVDHSTISPDGARQAHTLAKEAGMKFLDAPITGGSMGAQKGALTIFVGSEEEDYRRAAPVLDAYAKRHALVGGPGAGQTMKVANQVAVAGALLGLCEALAFAKHAGLDVAQTRDLLAGGAAGSWAFENYGPKILAEDWSPGFSIINQRKDLHYAAEAAVACGARIPGANLVNDLLAELENEGHGEWTTAALYELLARKAP